MLVGMFTDIHFQTKGLDRIISTGNWIIDEFTRQRVDRVICLGDSLNTREEVDVASQSACMAFFRKLGDAFPTDVLLGNHDINLKHVNWVSSLDPLAMHPKIKLHREMATDLPFFFIPYYEDQSKVIELIQKVEQEAPGHLKQYTCIGHLGINGAVQISRYNTRFTGAIGPDSFKPFRRTFSGHFHVHQTMDHNVTYIGSPLQFNFGDAGDQRGIVIYDTVRDTFTHIVNPYCEAFQFIASDQIDAVIANPGKYKDSFVTVIYDDIITEEQYATDKAKLISAGILEVKKESVVEKAIREHQVVQNVSVTGLADLIDPYVTSVLEPDSVLDRVALSSFGKQIILQVNAQHQDVADTGRVFNAHIHSIEMEGFLGVQENTIIDFDQLAPGVWYIEGDNGSGKSTIIEAIVWCQHGKNIREDMAVDDVVNDKRGKNCRVIIHYRNGYSIERFRKFKGHGVDGHSISGNGVRVYLNHVYQAALEKGEPSATQHEIDTLLGINYEWLTKTLIMGQNITANFVTADEKKRRAMLEEMLGLERFDEYLALVRSMKQDLSKQLEDQGQIQLLKSNELSRIVHNIQDYEVKILAAEQEHQQRLNSLGTEIHDHRTKAKAAKDEKESVLRNHRMQIAQSEKQKAESERIAEEYGKKRVFMEQAHEVDQSIKPLRQTLVYLNQLNEYHKATTAQILNNCDIAARRRDELVAKRKALGTIDHDAVVEARRRVNTMTAEMRGYQSALDAHTNTKQSVANRGRPLEPKLFKFRSLAATADAEGVCPTCENHLDKQGILRVLGDMERQMAELLAEANKSEEGELQARTAIQTITDSIDRLNASVPTDVQIASHKATIQAIDAELDQCYAVTGDKQRLLEKVDADVIAQGSKVIPDQPILPLTTLIDQVTAQIAALEKKSQDLSSQFDWSYWSQLQFPASSLESDIANLNLQITRDTQRFDTLIAQHETQAAQLDGQLHGLRTSNTVAVYREGQAKAREQRDAVQAEIESSKQISQQITVQSGYVTFWDRSFAAKGGMRAYLLEGSVNQLNTIIHGYSAAIFDDGMKLTFNPDLTVVERYPRRSGGQRKGTDLAVLFAAFELERQRCRYQSDFLALDEVFDALDTKHRRAVQEVIQVLSTRIARVFVISHMSLTGARMTGCIHTTLAPTGTQWAIKRV